ncbi:MAG: response regulator [Oligoflexales bacterium]
MTTPIHEKTASILVIEPSGALRQLIIVTIKKFGFSNITGVADMKGALGVMEADPIDWIITSVLKDDKINSLQLLPIVALNPVLKNTRISFFLDEDEKDYIIPAYEQGLFCHFSKPFNKDSLFEEISEHLKKYEEFRWEDTKFSAYCIFSYLRENKKFDLHENLALSLSKLYPGDLDTMLELAFAQVSKGDEKKAQKTLRQAYLLDDTNKKITTEFCQEHFQEPFDLEHKDDDEKWDLGIEVAFIIDPDKKNRDQAENVLGELGVKKIKSFEDSEAAWKEIEESETTGIVILEWKLAKISGAILSQRIRKKNPCTPIIALSADLSEDDQVILQEIGIEKVLKKPFEKQDLITTMLSIIRQEKLPTDLEMLELKIKQLLDSKKHEEAVKIKEQFLSNKTVPEFRRKKILADFAYYEGNYELARDLAIEVIKNQSDSITILNFIGKCLMKLGDSESALTCFKKAQEMSPQNIERLCNIAIVSQETGDKALSDDAMAKAKSLDSKNKEVTKTKATLAISAGDTSEAQKIMQNMDSLNEIISFMNNKAIALSKNGMTEEGIETYKQTLASIPTNKKKYQAAVSYNLALAYTRANQLKAALDLLSQVVKAGSAPIQRKSKSLEARIKRAIANGSEVILKQAQDSASSMENSSNRNKQEKNLKTQEQDHLQIIATINVNPGELCCYRLFSNNEPLIPEIHKLFKDPPRFNPRSAISKSKSAGIEKTMLRQKKPA